MFDIQEIKTIFQQLTERKQPAPSPIDNEQYAAFITRYMGVEITPDIRLFGYEEAVKENNYIATHYPEIANQVWMIADTGQGDGWFIGLAAHHLLFYDHEQGEYSAISAFQDFHIDFNTFLKMAYLFKALEAHLDKEDGTAWEDAFQQQVNTLREGLHDIYPFKY